MQIYALTADRAQELRVNMKVQNTTNYLLSYMHFRLGDEASGYRLSFNTSLITDPNDCLLLLNDAEFSTYDHDRDGSAVNCPELRGGGFWFQGSACSTCNPLGVLYQPSSGRREGQQNDVFWTSVLGDVAIFKISFYVMPIV